ncbi:hypothetical protein Acor_55140 [Acrocarpospora corrugata]|uniref:J domain-containing protein n=1 Tax=Acrocarpospora corrugata TaxID=35763 RepID=A0A5M3WAB5_9ACTN|nr:hypothetical protein [Acrocarpospora corrugata]GES03448.1 hypothetical protein Acor_55140 [Acrocarpospora corrugata]
MPLPDSSPYEILGLSASASAGDVKRAYQRAAREKRHPQQLLTHAFNELRNPRRRLEADVLSHDSAEVVDELRRTLADLPEGGFLAAEPVAPYPMSSLVVLRMEQIRADWLEAPPLALPFRVSPRFEVTLDVLPPLDPPL